MNEESKQGILWANSPPKHATGAHYDLQRLGAGKKAVGTIVGHNLVGVMVHWTGAKTQPCFGEDCRCKQTNQEVRWRGYVWFQDDLRDLPSILEMTPIAGQSVAAYFADHRTLRGTRWSFSRKGKKFNGMMEALVGKQLADHRELPSLPDLRIILTRIWGLPDDTRVALGPVIRDEIARALQPSNGQAK